MVGACGEAQLSSWDAFLCPGLVPGLCSTQMGLATHSPISLPVGAGLGGATGSLEPWVLQPPALIPPQV